MKKGLDLIGSKIEGFRFSDRVVSFHYPRVMDDYVGKTGEIVNYFDVAGAYVIEFEDGEEWMYPAELVEYQLKLREYPLTPDECYKTPAVYEHYKKKEHSYKIVEEIKTKIDGEWKDFVIYEQIETGEKFSRQKDEFFYKFDEVVTLTKTDLCNLVRAYSDQKLTDENIIKDAKRRMAERQKQR